MIRFASKSRWYNDHKNLIWYSSNCVLPIQANFKKLVFKIDGVVYTHNSDAFRKALVWATLTQ